MDTFLLYRGKGQRGSDDEAQQAVGKFKVSCSSTYYASVGFLYGWWENGFALDSNPPLVNTQQISSRVGFNPG